MDHMRDSAEKKPIDIPLQKTKLLYVCEVCGKEERLTPEEGYEAGWDYPPLMGQFGVISPRTCPHCTIEKTVWWDITANHKKIE